MSKVAARQRAQPALELLEESVRLLRRAPPAALLLHLGASAPCALYAVYFFTDLSRSAFAADHVIASSLLLALLFVVMKCGQAMSAAYLQATLLRAAPPDWTTARLLRLAAAQALLQPLGLVARLFALVIALPYVWVATFFQNAVVLGDGTPAGPRALSAAAWTEARRWPLQAHSLAGLLSVFGFFLYANVASLIMATPFLLKTMLGYETAASRYGGGMWNPTFLVAVYAAMYLLLDPLRKAALVLRCFHGRSLRTGEDLLADLATLRRPRSGVLVVALLGAFFLLAPTVPAQSPPPAPRVEAGELNRSIDDVLARREFTWRGERPPEEKKPERELTMVERWLKDFRAWKDRTLRSLADSVRKLFKRFFDREGEHSRPSGESRWFDSPRLLFGLSALALAIALAVLIARRFRPLAPVPVAAAAPATPDLNREDISADQLPEDGWLQLARDLAGRGELRLALRASYLASLAHLGGRQLILLARHKSNLDYARELQRRARARALLLEAFAQNLGTFERAWYGDHAVTPDTLGEFARNFDHIRAA